MKKKLNTIRDTLISSRSFCTNLPEIEQAILRIEYLIKELDSAELLERIAEGIVLSTGYNSDSPGFQTCINSAKREAQAAINIIKGEQNA